MIFDNRKLKNIITQEKKKRNSWVYWNTRITEIYSSIKITLQNIYSHTRENDTRSKRIKTIYCHVKRTYIKIKWDLVELIKALKHINWDILGLSEVGRTGKCIEAYPEFLLYHISQTPGRHGVGFVVKNTLSINKNFVIKNTLKSIFKNFMQYMCVLQI